MSEIRVGIIGIGNMGSAHLKNLLDGAVKGATATAVCDIDPKRLEWAQGLSEGLQRFATPEEFFAKADVDAVLVATPHYDHPPLAIEGFKAGKHVLIEKPSGVYTRQVREMNDVAAKSDKVFAIMFNQRTLQTHQKMRELIQDGELGELRRINWIITSWFRTQNYYDNGGWRATWAGEGGGVLLNQCPHQLDLWQWICGMPRRVRAFCDFGKYHDIEVEDDVTAFAEYENGATALFVTSTGEAPGTNRFEIIGDMGKLVLEDGKLTFFRNRVPMNEYLREAKSGFSKPENWEIQLPVGGGPAHVGVMQGWVDAILSDKPLMFRGEEGINGLELSNAMLLSAWTDNAWVDLPVDEDLFYEKLQKKIKTSTYQKKEGSGQVEDLQGTY